MSVNFLKAIHMETDPQTISAYLIYLSQHAPVEEQASHNDLALVITASCLSFHMSLYFQTVLFVNEQRWHGSGLPFALCRTLPGSSSSVQPSWTTSFPNTPADLSLTLCSMLSSPSSLRILRGWGRPRRARIFTAGWALAMNAALLIFSLAHSNLNFSSFLVI